VRALLCVSVGASITDPSSLPFTQWCVSSGSLVYAPMEQRTKLQRRKTAQRRRRWFPMSDVSPTAFATALEIWKNNVSHDTKMCEVFE